MQKIIRNIIFILACIFASHLLLAQQNNSLYYLNNVQQTNQLNPSITNNCKFSIGGIIMPVTGQILPPLYFNYSNNAFSYKNIIYPGEGSQSDSLQIVFGNLSDAEKFLKQLKEVNYLAFETNIDIIQATLNLNNQAFSFSITDKILTRFYYGEDFIKFIYELNGNSLLGTDAKFNIGTEFSYYREYGFGYQRSINEKLQVGGRAKLLFGKANVYTKNNEFSWYTDETDFAYDFNTNLEVNMSIPGITMNDISYSDSSHAFVVDNENNISEVDSLASYITNNKNLGFAIDLGGTYILNDEFTFYASIIDLGYINWKSNAYNISNTGNFQFDGVDIAEVLNDDSVNLTDQIMDTIFNATTVELKTGDYKTFLPTKIYLGTTYRLNEKIAFGGLIRTEIFQRKMHSSLTLSMNNYFSRKFQTSVSYSIINNSYFNFGFGFVYNTGPFQFYIVNDNITGMIFPQTARNINFRFGINWVFGCGVTNTTLIE